LVWYGLGDYVYRSTDTDYKQYNTRSTRIRRAGRINVSGEKGGTVISPRPQVFVFVFVLNIAGNGETTGVIAG